jgi:hypothetical protein
LKRMLKGTYISVEPFHLFRYLSEQEYRFNGRKLTDSERFKNLLGRTSRRKEESMAKNRDTKFPDLPAKETAFDRLKKLTSAVVAVPKKEVDRANREWKAKKTARRLEKMRRHS